jgi:hypothetical protein
VKETVLLTKRMRDYPTESHMIDVYEKSNGYKVAKKNFKK